MVESIHKTILVVDDTVENIQIMSGLLQKSIYRMQAATNGQEALEIAFSNNPPDLILLDILMHGMDGYEVIRQLKENERTSHIPVLFLTAKNSEIDEEIGLRLGAVDFITKPIRPAIVLQRIKIHLDLSDRNSPVSEHVEIIGSLSAVQDPDS